LAGDEERLEIPVPARRRKLAFRKKVFNSRIISCWMEEVV